MASLEDLEEQLQHRDLVEAVAESRVQRENSALENNHVEVVSKNPAEHVHRSGPAVIMQLFGRLVLPGLVRREEGEDEGHTMDNTEGYFDASVEVFINNLQRLREGEDVHHQVHLTVGY